MSVQVGQRGIDWSGANLTGPQIVAAGAHFAVRYSAGTANGSASDAWKLCKPGEIAGIVAAGADFIANSESTTDRITQGAGAGQDDGIADLAFWKSRGLNRGAAIYVSWDTEAAPSRYDAVEAYLKAYRAAMGGYFCPNGPGMYGASAAIREMKRRGAIAYGWQSESASFSDNGLPYQPSSSHVDSIVAAPPAGIDLWQNGNHWFNNGADEDVVLRVPVGSHLEAVAPKPPTPPKPPAAAPIGTDEGDTMFVVTIDKSQYPAGKGWPGDFVFNGARLTHIEPGTPTNSNTVNLLRQLGQKSAVVFTKSQYDAMKANGLVS